MRIRIALFTVGALGALAVAACDQEAPSVGEITSPEGVAVDASRGTSNVARTLQHLRKATAKWHDLDQALDDGYALFGCVDETIEGLASGEARGMGIHYVKPDLMDGAEADVVRLTEPELVVYGVNPANGMLRLAAFDYFIPASETYPSPGDGGTPPSFPDLGIPFTWAPYFNGWMFHIWPWWNNPDGMFDNFNPTVPLCD